MLMSVSRIHAIQMPDATIHMVGIIARVIRVSLVMVSTALTSMSVSRIHAIPMPHALIHLVDIIAHALVVYTAMV